MARNKTITHDQILNGAYEMVLKEGFSHFTARHIAETLKCSTQPIYLEFKNMDELKHEVLDKVSLYLRDYIYRQHLSDDPMLNIFLAYIKFATENKRLFNAVYIENHFAKKEVREFVLSLGMDGIMKSPTAIGLDEDEVRRLIIADWVVAQGLASLISAGMLEFDHNELSEVLSLALENISSIVRQKKAELKMA